MAPFFLTKSLRRAGERREERKKRKGKEEKEEEERRNAHVPGPSPSQINYGL